MKKFTIEITFEPYDDDDGSQGIDPLVWLKSYADNMIDDMHDDGIGFLPYSDGPWMKTEVSDV